MNTVLKNNSPTVLVLGGYGFIGRHVVAALKKRGIKVLIGTRREQCTVSSLHERQVRLHTLTEEADWENILTGVDTLINTVGILRQRVSESYEHVHHHAVAAMSKACAKQSIRLVHISALGLNNPVTSRFLTSKLRGEHALVKSNADWYLVRPSLVNGEGGYGATWFKRISRWPIHVLPTNAKALLAPIGANDLGRAIATIATLPQYPNSKQDSNITNRIYELGGHKIMTLHEFILSLRPNMKHVIRQPTCLRVPAFFARLLSHVCDVLRITPFSFGHYELLKYNNCPDHNRLSELLKYANDQSLYRHTLTKLPASSYAKAKLTIKTNTPS